MKTKTWSSMEIWFLHCELSLELKYCIVSKRSSKRALNEQNLSKARIIMSKHFRFLQVGLFAEDFEKYFYDHVKCIILLVFQRPEVLL